MARFTLPRDVYHGKGCLSELKNLKGKKAVLVVGGRIYETSGIPGQSSELPERRRNGSQTDRRCRTGSVCRDCYEGRKK